MSWYGRTNLQLLAGGLPSDCSNEQFKEFIKEARPMANKIVDDIEQRE